MSGARRVIQRFGLHLRVEHGLLALSALAAFGSGVLLGAGAPFATRVAPAALNRLHLWAGTAVVGVLLYHFIHLLVLGYLEGRTWSSFPLRWEAGDRQAIGAEVAFLLGRRAERPEADTFRVSQKALYWGTIILVAGTGVTGLRLALWDRLGGPGGLGSFADLHRGCALLLLGSVLWHLYGVFVWAGTWEPEWSWLTGMLDAGKACRKLPGFYRRRLREQEEREAALRGRSQEAVQEERRGHEKQEVQAELAAGNQLALEEKFVEALYHYRRALEMYPGYSQARYNMARVLARMGEKAMACEAYDQFIEAEPFHPLAGKAREALRELKEVDRP